MLRLIKSDIYDVTLKRRARKKIAIILNSRSTERKTNKGETNALSRNGGRESICLFRVIKHVVRFRLSNPPFLLQSNCIALPRPS